MLVSLAGCGRFDFGAHLDGTPSPAVDTSLAQAYPMMILAEHPIAYYRLDEASSAVAAVDVSGHANHGGYIITGGTGSFMTTGALVADADFDPAVSFQGGGNPGDRGSASVVPPETVFPWDGDFSVEGWIQPHSLPPTGWHDSFFVSEVYLVSGFRSGWTIDLEPVFWTDEAGGSTSIEGMVPLGLGSWNHLVITKSGTTVTMFVNGVLSAQGSAVYNPPAADDSRLELCFGACHGMPSDGVFDELAIYDYALPQARVTAHYATGTGRTSP